VLPQPWHPGLVSVSAHGGVNSEQEQRLLLPCTHCEGGLAVTVAAPSRLPAMCPSMQAHVHSRPSAALWGNCAGALIQTQALPLRWEWATDAAAASSRRSTELGACSCAGRTLESKLLQAHSQPGEEGGHLSQGHRVSVCFAFCMVLSKGF